MELVVKILVQCNVMLSVDPAARLVLEEVIFPVIVATVTALELTVPVPILKPESVLLEKVIPAAADRVIEVPEVIETVEEAEMSTVPPLSSLMVDDVSVILKVPAPSYK